MLNSWTNTPLFYQLAQTLTGSILVSILQYNLAKYRSFS